MHSCPLSSEFDFLEPPPQERHAIKYGKKFALAVNEKLQKQKQKINTFNFHFYMCKYFFFYLLLI